MLGKRRLAAGLAVLSLVFPAGALAQGAGDDQYEDPFAEEDTSQGGGQRGGGKGTGGGGGDDMDELSNAAPRSEAQASRQETPAGELPRTGSEPGVIALLGAGLLMTGGGLRLRVRRPVA